MKYVIILGDGMSDHPMDSLGGMTPLMAAKTQWMDRLASEGCCGMLETVPEGVAPGSEAANLSVMGYDPLKVLHGRGPLEAASIGIETGEKDLILRCNLVCLSPNDNGEMVIKNHSAGHITSEESAQLLTDLYDFLKKDASLVHPFQFYAGVSYRNIFIAQDLDERVEGFPPHDHVGRRAKDCPIEALCPEAAPTAAYLNKITEKSRDFLMKHPINQKRIADGKDPGNSIWLWSGGYRPKMWTYKERFGLNGAVISAVDLIRGIGVYAGLDIIHVPGATGLFDTNYEGKAKACLDALKDHDFVYVHVEAPDEAGHEGDLKLKIRTIEDLDRRLIAPIIQGIRELNVPTVVGVLPDHPTPVATRAHAREEVPFILWGNGITADAVHRYDEFSCHSGAMGHLRGSQFIEKMLSSR